MQNVTLAEYVWVDSKGTPRSKSRVLPKVENRGLLGSFPDWNHDGSSTGLASVGDSEIVLKPVATFTDPFARPDEDAMLVLCDCWLPNGTAHPLNTRERAVLAHSTPSAAKEAPWYGIEQEFFLVDRKTHEPAGKDVVSTYYCGAGSNCGRDIVLDAYRKALAAGLKVCGMNQEVAPGQWEIQIGPCHGCSAADELILLRYIILRCTEGTPYYATFAAKPFQDCNGSGLHTNFSTSKMRSRRTGRRAIQQVVDHLETKHSEHIALYGDDNEARLTGTHETSNRDVFSSGVGTRNTSVRIPNQVERDGRGYIEDRRPSSSADPYLIIQALADCCLATEAR